MDKITDYILGTRHPLWDWTEQEVADAVADFKEQQANYPFKLIIAICMYNEEDFLEECLDNCLLINDLDGIHILDGAWVDGGKYGYSTDNSTNIINNFKIAHPEIEVVYESRPTIWNKQGEKRNYQLKRIEQLWNEAYIIIKDGDEIFAFNSGKDNIWLKKELGGLYPAMILMTSYAYGSDKGMFGARVMATNQGIHYHTEKSMIVHNKDCSVLCDYNMDKQTRDEGKTYEYNKMFYINHWNIRNSERLKIKCQYSGKHVFTEDKPLGKCNVFNIEEVKV